MNNILFLSSLPISTRVFSFLFIISISYLLSTDDLASFFIVNNIYLLSSVIVLFGFNISGIKIIHNSGKIHPDKISKALTLCFSIRFILFFISLIVLSLLLYVYDYLSVEIYMVGVLFLLSQMIDLEFIFYYKKKIYIPLFIQLLSYVVAIIYLNSNNSEVSYLKVLLINALIFVSTNIISLLYLRIFHYIRVQKVTSSEIKLTLHQSFIFFLSSLFTIVLYKIPFFFLSYSGSASSIAAFGIFERLVDAIKIIPQNLARYCYQSLLEIKNNISKYFSEINKNIRSFLIYLFSLTTVIAVYVLNIKYFEFLPIQFMALEDSYFFLIILAISTYSINMLGLCNILIFLNYEKLVHANALALILILILYLLFVFDTLTLAVVGLLVVDLTIILTRLVIIKHR